MYVDGSQNRIQFTTCTPLQSDGDVYSILDILKHSLGHVPCLVKELLCANFQNKSVTSHSQNWRSLVNNQFNLP